MQLAHIELDNLTLSPANMRYIGKKKEPDVDDLVPSVRKRGILQTVLVEHNGTPDQFAVVAGWRRVCAVRKVRDEGGTIGPLPCGILEPGDDADALEASMIENLHRRAPDEMNEYESFTQLAKRGKAVEEIAATFGLEKRVVEQRLALGNLLPKIRDAYRAEQIDPDTIRHLTMATKSQQKDWLKMFEAEDENTPFGDDIKHWLCGGHSISTAVALFPVTDYKGHIIADLFGDNAYFQDTDMFWEQQNQAIAARRDAYLEAGWKGVVVLEPGESFQSWQFEKRPKKKGGKVFIAVSQRGEVTFHEGYCSRREAKRAETQTGADGSAPKPQSEVSGTLQTYLDLHRHTAVRATLADHPDVALRLMIAHAIGGSRLWSVKPDPQRSGRKETDESVQGSIAQGAFVKRRAEALTLLGLPEGAGLVAGEAEETSVLFARLLEMPEADVLRVLAVVMADSLEAGSPLVDTVGAHIQTDMAAWWRADDTFLALVRDKSVLDSMVEDICGKTVADANIAATGKVKRKIIRDTLDGTNGRQKVEGWVPRWMEFPARRYRAIA